MLPLIDEKNESYNIQKFCHIFKKKFPDVNGSNDDSDDDSNDDRNDDEVMMMSKK